MECLINIAALMAEYTVEPIGRQLGNLFRYKKNVEALGTQVENLAGARERLQHKVDEAKRNGEPIEPDLTNWLTKAEKMEKEKEDILARNEERASIKCPCGFKIPNMVLRTRLSGRMKEIAQIEIPQLTQGAYKFDKVSYSPPHQPSAVRIKGFQDFKSRKQTLEHIMEALKDPSVGMVGVWGMAGTGKTMLAEEVGRRAKDAEKLFADVVLTTVSQDPNIEKIQQEIGEQLSMSDVRAERLQNRFSQQNKLLIIVDDIWDKLDMEDVGISFGMNQNGSCKILLTSRSKHVLENDMCVDRNFHIADLTRDEAMSLFHKTVGHNIQADRDNLEFHDFQQLATEIVEECGRLPIAITTVASALRNKSQEVWKNAVHELRNSNPINIKGMQQKVYSSIN